MICNKIRKTKKVYCSNDFFYQIKILTLTPLSPAQYGKRDAIRKTIATKEIMCYLSKQDDVEFNVGGEAVELGTSLKVICSYFAISDILQNMERNTRDYNIEYEEERFELLHAHKVDLRNEFVELTGRRISNFINE